MRILWAGSTCLILVLLLHATANADGMAIPFMPGEGYHPPAQWTRPDGTATQHYASALVRVYEPGQRAIILFTGREQILCLSTEMRASEATAVLEMIPFPSEPTVSLGDFGTMQLVERLMLEHALPPERPAPNHLAFGAAGDAGVAPVAKLTFHEKMGAHDIAVVEVLEARFFRDWVESFFAERGAVNTAIREGYLDIVSSYLERGYRWFVFDTLYLTDSVQSRQPVQYRFATDHLYYPLLTSTQQTGPSVIDLLIIKRASLEIVWPQEPLMFRRATAKVNSADLRAITQPWAQFAGGHQLTLTMYTISGELQELTEDLIAYPKQAK